MQDHDPQDGLQHPAADHPRALRHCAYPQARDVALHGVQALPTALPCVDFAQSRPHRSRQHTALPATRLTQAQVLHMARVVGRAFAHREPRVRFVRPALHPPVGLMQARHADPFGEEGFGAWTKERLLYWFIRLFVLTDPASPKAAIRVNDDALAHSLAIVDDQGQVIGGAFNETLPALGGTPAHRHDDPFVAAVWSFAAPFYDLLIDQDTKALTALCAQYPAFRTACASGKVGHHFMVARSEALAKADTFELVAASAAHLQVRGHAYMVVQAANPWTGAACEALGAVRVHFAPFQGRYPVQQSAEPLDGMVTSATGWWSDKDSGIMFYVLRLA
jgi:hypothetical protein